MSELAKALVAFRAECPAVPFDKVNPHFDSGFASLAAIHRVVDPVLAKHNLCVLQFPVGDRETAGCVTRIVHESGESIEQEFRVPIGKADAQKACAAVSYARRFGLSGALGLVTTDDVDGNDAVGEPAGLMKPDSKREVKEAAQERSRHLDAAGHVIAWNEIVCAVAEDLGYESPADLHESDLPAMLAGIHKWEP